MITVEDVKKYLQSIPPLPETLTKSMETVERGDLPAAARIAGKDPILFSYFKDIVTKPIFGFQGKMEDITQIFGALGIVRVRQILDSYMLQLIKPKSWDFFDFDDTKFSHMQAECIAEWDNICEKMGFEDEDVSKAVILLPSTIIVCEQLFSDNKADVQMLRATKHLDLDTVLNRLTGMGFFHIAIVIGRKWKLNERSLKFLMLASGTNKFKNVDPKNLRIAQTLHLFFFMLLSRPTYMHAGMNEFIEFKPEFVESIMEEFMQCSGMAE